jgi:predicted XRE-type DNA-binding protein
LAQKEATVVIAAAQPDISKLKNGRLIGFMLDRLFSFLLRLNRNIEIRVTKTRKRSGKLANVAA